MIARRDSRFKMAGALMYENPSDPIGIRRIASDGLSGDGYKRSMWNNQPLVSADCPRGDSLQF